MREIDQVRITLLRMFSGAVQLPQEIINEMLKAFLNTRNAAIKVRAISRGYLLRRNPYNYMDDPAAKVFSYNLADDATWWTVFEDVAEGVTKCLCSTLVHVIVWVKSYQIALSYSLHLNGSIPGM